MARSFNSVTVMGNLTRDPELRATPNGQSVCSFSLALNRSYKDSASGDWKEVTDYVDVTAWAALGERVSQYCQKGKQVLVYGRLQSRSWEQDGAKRSKVEIVANDVIFLGGGQGAPGGAGSDGGSSAPAPAAKPTDDDVVIADVPDGEIDLSEIPF